MSDIRGLSQTPTYTPQSLPEAGAPSIEIDANSLHSLKNVDSAKLLADLAKLAATTQAQNPAGTPGLTNANGAPQIEGVNLSMSAEDMAAALLVLQGKTQEAQLSTAREGLTTNKKKLEDKNQKAMEKIQDWIQKCKDAQAKEKAAGIFGWLVKIVSVVAAAIAVAVAAAATVASGGAAAPLLALAVIGLVGATMSLASQISQSAGGPALELSSLMAKLCTTVLTACGVPEDQAEKAGKMMSGLAGLMSGAVLADPAFAGQAFSGFAELVGANANDAAIVAGVFTVVATIAIAVVMAVATGGASVADSLGKTVAAGARIAQAACGIASGAAAVTQGGLNIAKAHDERDAANIQADKKAIDAVIAKLQKQMEEDREEIKKVLDQIMEGMNVVSQMINSASQSRTQIASNLSGRGQTI